MSVRDRAQTWSYRAPPPRDFGPKGHDYARAQEDEARSAPSLHSPCTLPALSLRSLLVHIGCGLGALLQAGCACVQAPLDEEDLARIDELLAARLQHKIGRRFEQARPPPRPAPRPAPPPPPAPLRRAPAPAPALRPRPLAPSGAAGGGQAGGCRGAWDPRRLTPPGAGRAPATSGA